MKHLLLGIFFLFTATISYAGVEMVSFYFEEDNAKPTGYTTCKMDELHHLMETHHLQVIEINAFADLDGSTEENQQLASKRFKFVVDFFKIHNEEFKKNIYGKSKLPMNFMPYNWHRVDMYYYIGDETEEPVVESDTPEETVDVIASTPEKKEIPVPKRNEIVTDVPVILSINFEGGTNKLQEGAQPRLDQLLKTLETHTDLSAHLRGHVCCGNNRRISRKRAQVVYKYLKDRGVDKKRLSFKGYSNDYPLVFPETKAEDRAANRRVDVILSGK